ncbi:hypothetical protein CDAR_580671 [Caerostris darwini]|uniref:Uncharacterized protein n=1 Tax=Caerostris darwini TaxID=1538125 RepID=A0AAV4TUU4_9ARAC|nr:hypothetical protein CDAR_580671 [Caerostris darwini]
MKNLSTNFNICDIKIPQISKSNLPTESTAPKWCGLFPNDKKKASRPRKCHLPSKNHMLQESQIQESEIISVLTQSEVLRESVERVNALCS